jgi:hypothetical protein
VRNREHDVKVVRGQQVPFPCCEPALAQLRLALRTVPVAARVVGDGRFVSASGAGIDVTAQRCRAASLNGPESLELLKADVVLVPVQEAVALRAEDVSQLHGGPAHFCLLR